MIEHLSWHLDNQSIDVNNGPELALVVESLQERSKTLVEMASSMKMFYQDFKSFDEKLANKQFKASTQPVIELLIQKLDDLNDWKKESIHQIVKDICGELEVGFGKVGQPFRLALSGNGNAGAIDVVAELVGKDRTISRLQMALKYISQQSD